MECEKILSPGAAAFVALVAAGAPAGAATTVQVGDSGKTFASGAIQCDDGSPVVEAGLFNPKNNASAAVSLNGTPVGTVAAANPATDVWLAYGDNTVVVALNRKTADRYTFSVYEFLCTPPYNSGNTFSADGTLEYAASGKSYATVTPGCALNATTGQAQPYVHLFDNGGYLLNVSVNGIPLTQLSRYRTHTPVFLRAGQNVISAANASLSVDYYVRDVGGGTCELP